MNSSTLDVLVVDDSPEDRSAVHRFLAQCSLAAYTITEVDRADRALVACRGAPPDCVLLDYRLPDSDGLAVLESIREQSDVPVVLLIGKGNEMLAIEALRCGAQDYLIKDGLTPERLHLTIQRVIESVRLARERDHTSALLSSMLEALPIGAAVVDADLRLIQANAVLATMLNRPPAALHEQPLSTLWPDLAALLAEPCAQTLATGCPSGSLELADAATSRVWQADVHPLTLPDAGAPGFCLTIVEVTAQRKADAALRANNQRLRHALAAANLVAWEWDIPANTMTFSETASNVFGFAPDRLTRTLDELIRMVYPSDLATYEQAVATALQHGGAYRTEFRMFTDDGRLIWVEVSGEAQRDDAGRLVRSFGVTRDISAEKRRPPAQAMHLAISQALSPDLDVAAVIEVIARQPLPNLADVCVLYLLDADGIARPAAAFHGDPITPLPPAQFPAPANSEDEASLLGTVLRTGTSRPLAEATLDPALELGSLAPRSALLVPLATQGKVLGVMLLGITTEERRYDADDLALAEALARRGAEALVQARLRVDGQAARRSAAEALARLDALITSAPFGIGYLDRDLRYVLINPALATLNGRTPAEHLGRSLGEIIPQLAVQIEPTMRQVLATGAAVQDLELYGKAKDGVLHTWLLSCFPVPEPTGEVAGVGVTVNDITPIKHAEAALYESETRYRTLFETMAQGVVYHDVDGQVTEANPAAERILGLSNVQMRRCAALDPHWRAIHEDGTPFPKEDHPAIEALRTGQEIRDVVMGIYNSASESYRWINIQAVPQFRPGETKPTQAYTIFSDETERLQSQRALEYERQQLAAIVRTIHEGVVAFTPDGAIAIINEAALRLANLESENAPTTLSAVDHAADLLPHDTHKQALPPDEWPAHRVLRGESFAEIELCMRPTGQGTERWFAINGTPVYDERGALVLGIITTQDITARKHNEATLQSHAEALSRANAELTRALQLKDEFLAMISHELRTPLSIILGFTESLAEEIYGPISSRQQEALTRVTQSGKHLLAILSDILDLTYIESGKEILDIQSINVDILCRAAIQLVQAKVDQKNIRLMCSMEQGITGVRADKRRLTQILVNLLDNAVKFTPAGGTVGLEVSFDDRHEHIQLVVWDTGVGIAEDDYPRLFQPFTQVEGGLSRKHGGVGLGLTLVRRLVDLHGGSVSLESVPGEGSRFTVSLPWSAADNVATTESEEPPPVHAWVKPPRVVIADDHEPSLVFYRDLLALQGCQVATARTGREALEQVRATRPDVAVLDIQMPEMDGLTAIRHIRADPATAHVPIIAMTALAMPGDRERCLAAGANVYMAKPMGLRALIAVIAGLLEPSDSGAADRDQ